MSEQNKKGGFWSWFGLGKNKQQQAESEPAKENLTEEKTESEESPSQQSVAEKTFEKTTALTDNLASEPEQDITASARDSRCLHPRAWQPRAIYPLPSTRTNLWGHGAAAEAAEEKGRSCSREFREPHAQGAGPQPLLHKVGLQALNPHFRSPSSTSPSINRDWELHPL